MTTRKRWTKKEEVFLLDLYDNTKTEDLTDRDVFELIKGKFENKGRTARSLESRYYILRPAPAPKAAKVKVIEHKEVPTFTGFLEALESLKMDYQATKIENERLKRRIIELEQQAGDYEAVVKIIEKARKMVVTEELGEVEQIRLKMDQNGNLDRVR